MESAPPPPSAETPGPRSPLLAALLGLLVPGLGQVYVGRPAKGALFLLAVLPTFLLGWALTDFTIVSPSRYALDFAAQAPLGGTIALAWSLAEGHVLERLPPFFEVGRLYTQVAGLLNLVVIADAVGEAIRRTRVHAARAALRVPAPALVDAPPPPEAPA